MKPILMIAALAAVVAGGTTTAVAQSGMVVIPSDRSTGPTVPSPGTTDTRQIDQNIATAPADTSPNSLETPNAKNWRSSSGLNTDPDNPNGAPGPSSGLGTSPTR